MYVSIHMHICIYIYTRVYVKIFCIPFSWEPSWPSLSSTGRLEDNKNNIDNKSRLCHDVRASRMEVGWIEGCPVGLVGSQQQ